MDAPLAKQTPREFAMEVCEVLESLVEQHRGVERVPAEHFGLRKLLSTYRALWRADTSLDHVSSAVWYGVFADNSLVAAVGLQDQRDPQTDESFLFICDFVGTGRPLARLTAFVEDIPYTLRGAILAKNIAMSDVVLNRGSRKNKRRWETVQRLVESRPV